MKLVECVPNFSEGRDKAKVESIVSAAREVPGVRVLDVETDPDHHRCVLSFVAPPEAALEAAFRSARKARELIDLTVHKGEHPRMGAVDVIPFIPVSQTSIADCASLAEKLGERIGRELEIPVYLYDRAAKRPERQDLANVRKGQFEGLRDEIGKNPERDPDFGPKRIHPTAGAVAVGAREQIINFNVNLSGVSMEQGKAIAKKVRASGGGLPCLRAKEIDLAAKGFVQVSTVLTDCTRTPLAAVYDAIDAEAKAAGGRIAATEIIGLLPRKALIDFSAARLKAEGFDPSAQVLEERLEGIERGWESAAMRMTEAFADVSPTPGGGSAAAVSGALACALAQMASGVSVRSKKADEARKVLLAGAIQAFDALRQRLHRLAGEDAASFDGVMEALKIPKEDPRRAPAMAGAFERAAEVPLKTAAASLEALEKLQAAEGLAVGSVASDMNCARHLLRAAVLCALENVRINVSSIRDPGAAQRLTERARALEDELKRR
ncbi:MAG: glutamate formimidoyltransferase [Elusimicrobia bacterium]|nr:glutamate formimidoyltransferase [Elusimicrobiota bacterium]